jgi:hypothetical protein
MATERQIAANKLNAQKSTGPRTEEGKGKSRLNRLSHGLASSATTVPGENPAEFIALLADLTAEHQPATATEQILVEKMAQNQWLSLRAFRLQGEAFLDRQLNGESFGIPKDLGLLIRYQTSAERAFHKAHNELVKAKKQRQNSEIGFESQNFGQEVPAEPETQPEPAPVVPISPKFSLEPRPEAAGYLKKVG